MINYLSIYTIVSILMFFLFSKISFRLNLIDFPSKRKTHKIPTAYTGGVALSLIYIFSIFLFDWNSYTLNLILSMSFLIGIIGLIDDKYTLNVSGKLSLQIIPIIYLVIIEQLALTNLGDYYYFKIELNSFSIPFSIIAVLLLINSFNYFDGLDGTLGISVISTLGILFFLLNDSNIKLFIIIIIIPILLFLFFNFSIFKLEKLFLGDSGSLLLGFIISFILIYLASRNIVHPILLAWSIAIFVYEFISIHIIRLMNDQHLFQPGRDHLHYILLEKSKSIFLTNLSISLGNIILFSMGYMCFTLINPLASFVLFIFLFIIFIYFRNLAITSR